MRKNEEKWGEIENNMRKWEVFGRRVEANETLSGGMRKMRRKRKGERENEVTGEN